jgi:hypothetical protein
MAAGDTDRGGRRFVKGGGMVGSWWLDRRHWPSWIERGQALDITTRDLPGQARLTPHRGNESLLFGPHPIISLYYNRSL